MKLLIMTEPTEERGTDIGGCPSSDRDDSGVEENVDIGVEDAASEDG